MIIHLTSEEISYLNILLGLESEYLQLKDKSEEEPEVKTILSALRLAEEEKVSEKLEDNSFFTFCPKCIDEVPFEVHDEFSCSLTMISKKLIKGQEKRTLE